MAALDFMNKKIDALKLTNPAQTIGILKARQDFGTYTLENHEKLTPVQAAEQIAIHFSKISQEFSPLSKENIPERVVLKLANPESESCVPQISSLDVYNAIISLSLGFHMIYHAKLRHNFHLNWPHL